MLNGEDAGRAAIVIYYLADVCNAIAGAAICYQTPWCYLRLFVGSRVFSGDALTRLNASPIGKYQLGAPPAYE